MHDEIINDKLVDEHINKPSENDIKIEEELLKNVDQIMKEQEELFKLNPQKEQIPKNCLPKPISIPMDPDKFLSNTEEKTLTILNKEKEKEILEEKLKAGMVEKEHNEEHDKSFMNLKGLRESKKIYHEKYIKSKHEKLISYAILNEKDEIIVKTKSLENIQVLKEFSLAIVDNKNKILAKVKSPHELLTLKNALTYLLSPQENTQPDPNITEWATKVKFSKASTDTQKANV